MPSSDPFRPSVLRRATSRTRTGPALLLKDTEALFIHGSPFQVFEHLYAGPVDAERFPPLSQGLGWIMPNYPTEAALQIFAFVPASEDVPLEQLRENVINHEASPAVDLIVDLGKPRQISRVELYGNFMLPPLDHATGPLFNFGLPRTMGIAISESRHDRVDFHGMEHHDVWLDSKSSPFKSRYEARDLRALWGWTPIHLPPTYGRYLLFHFADLPLIFGPTSGGPLGRGINIQRLLIYPYLEDVDHYPTVESSLVSVRQTNYPKPDLSFYWSFFDPDPQPETHQSVANVAETLPWPTSLTFLPISNPYSENPTDHYVSDIVELDSSDRIVLTVAATSDEIPILDALRLVCLPNRLLHEQELPYIARVGEFFYLISVYVTNDEQAAWSPDLNHPNWRLVHPFHRFAPEQYFTTVTFVEPVRARYVRAVIAIHKVPSANPRISHGRLLLSRLALARCRDFVLSPEPDEDLQVDSVLLRFRGKSLTDDYAFINGADGLAISLETRTAGGPFEEIRRINHLLDIVENTNARLIVNPRLSDKSNQTYKERVETLQTGTMNTHTTSKTNTDITMPDDTHNVTVSRTGSQTTHVKNAQSELTDLGDPEISEFPHKDTGGVTTRRTYDAPGASDLPNPLSDDPTGISDFIVDLLSNADSSPIPVNFGVGVSGLGVSLSAGGTVGGGKTLAVVRGDQASVAESQTTTLYSEAHQHIESTGSGEQSRTGSSVDDRWVFREDSTSEIRKTGISIRYGGAYEDVILVTIPVRRLLTGRSYVQSAPDLPPTTGDMMRVRVDHLPEGVSLDVEFRGAIIPVMED